MGHVISMEVRTEHLPANQKSPTFYRRVHKSKKENVKYVTMTASIVMALISNPRPNIILILHLYGKRLPVHRDLDIKIEIVFGASNSIGLSFYRQRRCLAVSC
jgi:hypothetical protein